MDSIRQEPRRLVACTAAFGATKRLLSQVRPQRALLLGMWRSSLCPHWVLFEETTALGLASGSWILTLSAAASLDTLAEVKIGRIPFVPCGASAYPLHATGSSP